MTIRPSNSANFRRHDTRATVCSNSGVIDSQGDDHSFANTIALSSEAMEVPPRHSYSPRSLWDNCAYIWGSIPHPWHFLWLSVVWAPEDCESEKPPVVNVHFATDYLYRPIFLKAAAGVLLTLTTSRGGSHRSQLHFMALRVCDVRCVLSGQHSPL
jgi:hypothetical protein